MSYLLFSMPFTIEDREIQFAVHRITEGHETYFMLEPLAPTVIKPFTIQINLATGATITRGNIPDEIKAMERQLGDSIKKYDLLYAGHTQFSLS